MAPRQATYSLSRDPDSDTVVIRIVGPVDGALHRRVFEEIAAAYDVGQTNFLWNLTEASFSQFSLDEVQKMREIRAEFAGARRDVKSCIWINDTYERMLVRLYEELNRDISPEAEIVFCEEDARAYLGIADTFPLPKGTLSA